MAGNTSDTQFQSDLTLLSNLNLNWSTESGYGQNLVTTYQVDSQGRTIEETTPDGDVTFTVYNDANHEIRVYPGWHENSSGQWLPTGPVSDYRTDSTGKYTETLTYSWTNVANLQSYLNTNNTPTGQEPLTGGNVAIQSLSRSILDSSGQVISSLQYVNFNGTSYSTATAAFGTWGTNYIETDYTYDPMGRAESTITPAGAVSFTVYNGLGQATDQWVGTTTATSYTARNAVIVAFRSSGDDSPSPSPLTYAASGVNLFATSSSVYNADGLVTATTAYVDTTSAHNRVYSFGYDWLDEQTYAVQPSYAAGVTYTMTTYDNLGEAVKTQQYSYQGSETNGIPTPLQCPRRNRPRCSIPAMSSFRRTRPLTARSARSTRRPAIS